MDPLTRIVLIGLGATALTDLWGVVRLRLLGIPRPDYGLVGRWFGHMPRGRFHHDAIARATPVAGELAIGWAAHFAIGIAFAFALHVWQGPGWSERPTLGPALVVGVITVLAPLLVMQPGMGAGLAASRTPAPWRARTQALITHAVFGAGLYATAWALRAAGAS